MAYESIIEYYDAGAPASTHLTRDNAKDYKDRSKQYKKMLKEEYYDNENPRGVQSLYNILKAKHPRKCASAVGPDAVMGVRDAPS